MVERTHAFEDGERVRIKETGEVVTVDHWWFAKKSLGGPSHLIAQYNIVEHPATWFAEYELEKADDNEV
jgi:hypothetical protein